MSNPNTTIRLYQGVPLDNTYRNICPTLTGLQNYSNATLLWTGQTWTRYYGLTNNKVRLYTGTQYSDNFLNCNYISFSNRGLKTIYGFITDILYINDNVMEITFDVDVISTYWSNFTFGECIVERQTTESDTIGGHILPEPLNCDDHVIIKEEEYYILPYDVTGSGGNKSIVIFTWACPSSARWDPSPTMQLYVGDVVNGIPAGTRYTACDCDIDAVKSHVRTMLNYGVYTCLSAYIVPQSLYSPTNAFTADYVLDIPTYSLTNDYVPKNNKLFSYPYTYIEVCSNIGDSIILRPENFFSAGHAYFRIFGTAVPTPQVYVAPYSYNGITNKPDFQTGLLINNFPAVIVQESDINTYMAQHDTGNAIKTLATTITSALTGAVMGGAPMATAMGGSALISGFGNAMANYANEARKPVSYTGGNSNGSLQWRINEFKIKFKIWSLKEEILASYDSFFTKYGYNLSQLTTPTNSFTNNRNYNYNKTKNCNLKNNTLPTWASKKICEIYDSGVTMWNSLANVGVY